MTTTSAEPITSRTCPLCGSSELEMVGHVRAPNDPDQLGFDELTQYWRGFRSRPCFFEYARCAGCALLYCRRYFTESMLDQLYSSMPDNTMGARDDDVSRTQRGYVTTLARFGALDGTYLEIGPDIGLAAAAAREMGHIAEFLFVEPNRDVHPALHAVGQGVPTTIVRSIDQLPPDPSIDLAVLVHVVDHLIDPLLFMQRLRARMSKGGKILVVVHNESSMLRRVVGKKWPPFCLQHPQLYSPSTIRGMLESAGFKVATVAPSTNYLSTSFVLENGMSLLGAKVRGIGRVPSLSVPVRLGNMIVVAEC